MSQRKSSVEEIRQRFDGDVERFSNLATGQSATVDAPLALDLIAEAAATTTPGAKRVLDVGCGAGNYTLKLLERLPGLHCTLVDLSRPMLDRAAQRVGAAGGAVQVIQGDIRELNLGEGTCDIILAAAVLHHLRTDAEWEAVFTRFHAALAPGGSLWIFDMVEGITPATHGIMKRRYGDYLAALKGEPYRDEVFAYIEKEDTPKPLFYQLDLLRRTGFTGIEILHKNSAFAAFGACRGGSQTRPR